MPDELEGLEKRLSDTYYCNFSLFRSQLTTGRCASSSHPAHPPAQQGPPAERCWPITYDSDGKIDEFIDLRDVKHTSSLPAQR